ncbi:MAG: sigma 54-interacting transcriptional regulator, partial [Fibrobacterota bacterium]
MLNSLLSDLPAALKNTALVYTDPNFVVRWASRQFYEHVDAPASEIPGKNFFDFIETDDFYRLEDTFALLARLKVPEKNKNIRRDSGLRLFPTIIKDVAEGRLIQVDFRLRGIESYFINYNSDFFAVLDKEGCIVEYNYRFMKDIGCLYPPGQIRRKKLEDLFTEESFRKFQEERRAFDEINSQNLESSSEIPWIEHETGLRKGSHFDESVYTENFRPLWEIPEDGSLKREDDGDRVSFALFENKIDQLENDVRLEFRIDSGNPRAVLCCRRKFFRTPDESGYTAGIYEGQSFLKRNAETVKTGVVGADKSFVLEKTGNNIFLFRGGEKILEYTDYMPFPIYHKFEDLGFLSMGKAEISGIKLKTKPSVNSKTFSGKHIMQLRGREDLYFELTVFPFYKSGIKERVYTALRLRDITEFYLLGKEKQRFENEVIRLKSGSVKESGNFHGMIYKSVLMENVFDKMRKAARTDLGILITGETGTGKTMMARSLHLESERADRALVHINCATIPENLIESELFGHEKGAFTGADKAKKGKLEEADGGTVFLDEIGNLSPTVQAKLLRFLQEGKFERIGSNDVIEVDTRLVSATNSDLQELVNKGAFRKDLLYRLNPFIINIPPLRERTEDIVPLARYFVYEMGKKEGYFPEIELAASDALLKYYWPGNVRELINAINHVVLLNPGEPLKFKNLPDHIRKPAKKEVSVINRVSSPATEPG